MTEVEKIKEALQEFSWWNYGLNEIDQLLHERPADDQEWIGDLAKEIAGKLGLEQR